MRVAIRRFAGLFSAAMVCVALAGGLPGAATGQEAGGQMATGQEAAPAMSLDAVMEAERHQIQRSAGGSVRPPADAVANTPMEPGVTRPLDAAPRGAKDPIDPLGTRGLNSDATLWGEIRHGETFTTQAPGPVSDFLVQDAGMGWQAARAKGGSLQVYGFYGLAGVLVLLVAFYLFRGKIRIDAGRSGDVIERFRPLERFGHWLLAGSFILLALTGLNLLYGKDYLLPLIGKEAFASATLAGKWVHNNVAWAFMASLVLVFLMWVLHNIPSRIDLIWLAKGGGLFSKNVHPPSRKFNAGQKIIFWSTILLGASVSASGLALLFPYELPMFGKTFSVLNSLGAEAVLGTALPETLTPIQEMQYAQLWHTIVAFGMIVVILAHIYIGSVGMEGAFDAMGSGQVDRNWAKEHHGLWVEEHDAKEAKAGGARSRPAPAATPAE